MTFAGVDWLPWLAFAGLGVFHGLNPGMGWLFAVAIGLHRGGLPAVLVSLVPIALGHAAAVAAVVFAALAFGFVVEFHHLAPAAGVVLITWALWHALYGRRHRLRVGMRAGALGLFVWSALMALTHGAGLMLFPFLLPLCLAGSAGRATFSTGVLAPALAAIGLHTAAMLATIAAISVVVYSWTGLDFLRRGWVNLDLVWVAALIASGAALIAI